MNRAFTFATGLGLAVLVTACAAPPAMVDTSADEATIRLLADREIAAFAANDMAVIETLFSADCVVMPPNEPAIQGRDALMTWGRSLADQYTITGGYDNSTVVVSGDLAVQYFIGHLSMTPKAGGQAMSETIKGMHVLRKQADGSWQITHDVWNSNTPPAMPGGN
jgi:uncharacterized protein (TIGR02246 family)